MVNCLKDKEESVRRHAIHKLSETSGQDKSNVAVAVCRCLQDPKRIVREAAAQALPRLAQKGFAVFCGARTDLDTSGGASWPPVRWPPSSKHSIHVSVGHDGDGRQGRCVCRPRWRRSYCNFDAYMSQSQKKGSGRQSKGGHHERFVHGIPRCLLQIAV